MNGICKHCGGELAIANPKGFCSHIYYPENCTECTKRGLTAYGAWFKEQAVSAPDGSETAKGQ